MAELIMYVSIAMLVIVYDAKVCMLFIIVRTI